MDAATQPRVLITDTTMRDAHQSLLATRDADRSTWPAIAPYLRQAAAAAVLGGDAGAARPSMSPCGSCSEDPWERLAQLRERMPNLLLQMLFRVGECRRATRTIRTTSCASSSGRRPQRGIDVFRIFDCLNWVENMRVVDRCGAGDRQAVRGRDLLHGRHLSIPRERSTRSTTTCGSRASCERRARISSASRTWPGLCRPRAARALVKALKEEIGLPIHFHTHDTSGIAAASVLAAVEAGVDAVDCAIDSMSGLTSQPNLGSTDRGAAVHGPRDTGIDPDNVRCMSAYWEAVRASCTAPSRATSAPAPPRFMCMACRGAVHQPARAGPVARLDDRAGRKSRRRMPT